VSKVEKGGTLHARGQSIFHNQKKMGVRKKVARDWKGIFLHRNYVVIVRETQSGVKKTEHFGNFR
jgi:hypothetical protein